MILTDYYRFEKLPNQKAGTRMDCTISTKSYNPFEKSTNSKGGIVIYIGKNPHKPGRTGKSDLSTTNPNGDNITSIYTPDVALPYWYGDTKDTSDALLMIHTNFGIINGRVADGSIVEVFVARGQKHNVHGLYTLLVEGDLDEEMQQLRERAKSCHEPNTLY